MPVPTIDRKSTRLNSSHTVIYTLSLHDALPIYPGLFGRMFPSLKAFSPAEPALQALADAMKDASPNDRSEEHTSELQSHSDLHSFPTRRSSDLSRTIREDVSVAQGVLARGACLAGSRRRDEGCQSQR